MASKLVADSTKTVTFHFVYSGRATPLLYGDSAPANFPLKNNTYLFKAMKKLGWSLLEVLVSANTDQLWVPQNYHKRFGTFPAAPRG